MNQLSLMVPTIKKEWKQQAVSAGQIYMIAGSAASSAALAWIINQSGNFGTLAYLCIGVALISIWRGSVAISGWSLSNELWGKTLEFTLISRASLPLVLFSKILAQIAYEIPGGIVSVLSVLLVVRQIPDVVNPGFLPISIILAIIGLAVLSLFLADLVVLVGGRSGFFMGVVPFGAVLSGFILPVHQLPRGFEVVARLMPTSWAMDSVWLAVRGTSSPWPVLTNWGISVLLILVWFVITIWMCKVVEKRIRVQGTLGAF